MVSIYLTVGCNDCLRSHDTHYAVWWQGDLLVVEDTFESRKSLGKISLQYGSSFVRLPPINADCGTWDGLLWWDLAIVVQD